MILFATCLIYKKQNANKNKDWQCVLSALVFTPLGQRFVQPLWYYNWIAIYLFMLLYKIAPALSQDVEQQF